MVKNMDSSNWETVIGLEVHCELSTDSKVFCGCKNTFGAPPNTHCCDVCMGLPGTVPRLNKKVVDYALLMGFALNCHINTHSAFDRKHYFYPDLPKSYQITQYYTPICVDGYIELPQTVGGRRIGIERIHIEEDAGKLIHAEDGYTLADYNRSGVPLVEIVTKPDLRTADEAKACMEEIALIAQYMGVSNVKMHEGNLRADVNVSLRRTGCKSYGSRVEMKNLNSFSAAVRAIEYEVVRQKAILNSGRTVLQETRRWDDDNCVNIALRDKSETIDYLFFPEPDLQVLGINSHVITSLMQSMPMLPGTVRQQCITNYGLSCCDADLIAKHQDRSRFFLESSKLFPESPRQCANWLLGDISKYLNEHKLNLDETMLTPERFSQMLRMIHNGCISGAAAKQVLEEMLARDIEPEAVVEAFGLCQISDHDSLLHTVNAVLADNPLAVKDYMAGKKAVAGFLVGKCMKHCNGQANPAILKDMLENKLRSLLSTDS